MKKSIIIFLLLIFLTGCSFQSDFSKFTNDKSSFFDQDIIVSGKLFIENSNYFLLDSNDMKLTLINCKEKYNFENGRYYTLNGFLTYDQKLFFTCGIYNETILNLNSEILAKSELMDSYDIRISEKETVISNLNSDINSKNIELSSLKIRVDEAELNKIIDTIKKDVTDKMKLFPEKIKIEDFRDFVMGEKDYESTPIYSGIISINGPVPDYYIDEFYYISQEYPDYSVSIKAYRDRDQSPYFPIDSYRDIEIFVEHDNEKFICSRNVN